MPVEANSQSASPSIGGGAASFQDLELVASDGNHFAAFAAHAENPQGPGVVILPDVRGLFRFYEELALRFAEVGYDAVAFDYFGRTAGVGKRAEDFPYQEHVAQTTIAGVSADAQACVDYLRQGEGDAERNIFTMGFCFGGSNSWIMAQTVSGLAGVVGFYGHPTRQQRDGAEAVIDRVQDFRIPLLGLMGGADEGIPQEEIEKFDRALSEVGVQHKLVTYPGAPHSFFDRHYEQHADAVEDAWKRVLDFIWGGTYWAE
jgi:carboxymethylenebutenolidase